MSDISPRDATAVTDAPSSCSSILIEEHQSVQIRLPLAFKPGFAFYPDVLAVQFADMSCLLL